MVIGLFSTVIGLFMIGLGFLLHFQIQFGDEKRFRDIELRDIFLAFLETRITKDIILEIVLFICGGIMLVYGLIELNSA